MSAFTDWLSDTEAERVLLAEVKVWSGGAETTRYLSTHGFKTDPGDTPANTYYDQRLVGDPFFERRLNEVFGGRTFVGIGGLEIDNLDGSLDGWLTDAFDGRRVTLKLGDPSWSISEFGTILVGTAERLEVVDDSTLRLIIRDRQAELNIAVQENLISTGDSANEPIPLCYGLVRNIEPVLIDSATLEYQVHDGPINDITNVYDNGISVAFTKNLANGKFTLNQNPYGRITCSVQGAKPSAYLTKTGEIIRDLVSRVGPLTDPGDLNTTSFSDLDTAVPYTVGLYIRDRRNLLDALDELVLGIRGYYGFDRNGLFEVGRLEAPSGSAVMEIDGKLEIFGDLRVEMDEIPQLRTRLGYQRNWTVQGSDLDRVGLGGELAGGVTNARRGFLANEYRTASASDSAVKTAHLSALDPERLPTLIDSLTDANTEASRQQTLFGTQRFRYEVEGAVGPYQLKLNDPVTLKDARFGLAAGVLCRVIGIRESLLDNRVEVMLWR